MNATQEDQLCFYCEKTAGPDALQETGSYALVCPHCKRLNSIRASIVGALPVLVVLVVAGEVKVLASDVMHHVFNLIFTVMLREIPVLALLLVVGFTVFGAVKLAKIIKGRQPRTPAWHEDDYPDSGLAVSYTIKPPFRDEPARILVEMAASQRQVPHDVR